MIPHDIRPQVELLVDTIMHVLGDDLVGIYVHGSALQGSFGPNSDIDVLAVSRAVLPCERRQVLLQELLDISGKPRPVELDLVLASSLESWSHPAPFEFHFSESLRPRFEAGELEPWESATNRDLAAHITVVRDAGVVLVGPPPAALFPPIPERDFHDALLFDVEWWRAHLTELEAIPGGIRNAVLSLARVWATLATGSPHSKATGAAWALPRLPGELRPVLEHGSDVYAVAQSEERWESLPVASYVATVADEIDRLVPATPPG